MKNRQRRAAPKAGSDLSKKLYISLLSILVCTVCLASTTWAWYAGTDWAAVAGIQIASYQVTAEITGPYDAPVTMENGSCTLRGKTQYTVQLSLASESTATTGYCVLMFGEGPTQTTKTALVGKETLTFTAAFNEGTTFTLDTFLGNPPAEAESIQDGSKIGDYTPPTQADPNPENQPEIVGPDGPATSQEPTETTAPTTPTETTLPTETTPPTTETTEASEPQTEPSEPTETTEQTPEQTPPASGDAADPTGEVPEE